MSENYLYMFEFIIEDLLITRPNECSPDEYPTCVEFMFRDIVYAAICVKDFGKCNDKFKTGKCVIFSLDKKPVTKDDKLLIVVSRKKEGKICKFIIGATTMDYMNDMFEKVNKDFEKENPYVAEERKKSLEIMEKKKKLEQKTGNKMDIGEEAILFSESGRPEEFCVSSDIVKMLFTIFDKTQTRSGNIIVLIRLSCLGPNIASCFPIPKKKPSMSALCEDAKEKRQCKLNKCEEDKEEEEEVQCCGQKTNKKNKNDCDDVFKSRDNGNCGNCGNDRETDCAAQGDADQIVKCLMNKCGKKPTC